MSREGHGSGLAEWPEPGVQNTAEAKVGVWITKGVETRVGYHPEPGAGILIYFLPLLNLPGSLEHLFYHRVTYAIKEGLDIYCSLFQ